MHSHLKNMLIYLVYSLTAIYNNLKNKFILYTYNIAKGYANINCNNQRAIVYTLTINLKIT